MTPTANAATAMLIVSALAACGSVSNLGQDSTQAAQADQICRQSSAFKPDYPRSLNKLDDGATTLSRADAVPERRQSSAS